MSFCYDCRRDYEGSDGDSCDMIVVVTVAVVVIFLGDTVLLFSLIDFASMVNFSTGLNESLPVKQILIWPASCICINN